MKPLVIELFAGKRGWGKGFVSEGWRHIGFDIVHEEWHRPVPDGCLLVLQDVLTLHGSQFREADAIVASPPCQEYSYRAMPWKRAKALPPPSNALFDACFRIQREASEAKGEYIPMVVENVKGAQPWVGRAAWHFGSFYLWGDVPLLMPIVIPFRKSQHTPLVETPAGTGKTSWFFGNSKHEGRFYGVKVASESGRRTDPGNGVRFTTRDCGIERAAVKGMSGLYGFSHPDGKGGRDLGGPNDPRRFSSKSLSRKAASAAIAEIPFELSSYLARVFKP